MKNNLWSNFFLVLLLLSTANLISGVSWNGPFDYTENGRYQTEYYQCNDWGMHMVFIFPVSNGPGPCADDAKPGEQFISCDVGSSPAGLVPGNGLQVGCSGLGDVGVCSNAHNCFKVTKRVDLVAQQGGAISSSQSTTANGVTEGQSETTSATGATKATLDAASQALQGSIDEATKLTASANNSTMNAMETLKNTTLSSSDAATKVSSAIQSVAQDSLSEFQAELQKHKEKDAKAVSSADAATTASGSTDGDSQPSSGQMSMTPPTPQYSSDSSQTYQSQGYYPQSQTYYPSSQVVAQSQIYSPSSQMVAQSQVYYPSQAQVYYPPLAVQSVYDPSQSQQSNVPVSPYPSGYYYSTL